MAGDTRLMCFTEATFRDPAVESWFAQHPGALGGIARHWFEVMRGCGPDVRELLHDGHPTACVGEAAFGYVNAFSTHVNVGFFLGARLEDPNGLLEGTGRYMRHVKLRPDVTVDEAALAQLLRSACAEMRTLMVASGQFRLSLPGG